MGYALRLEDVLPAEPEAELEALAGLSEELARTSQALREAEASFRTELSKLEERTASLAAGFARFLASAQAQGEKHEVNLGEAVEEVRNLEEEDRAQLLPFISSIEKARAKLSPHAEGDPAVVSLMTMYDEMLAALTHRLEVIRDFRWQLLAHRAEVEDQKGTSFDSADDLLRHLHGS